MEDLKATAVEIDEPRTNRESQMNSSSHHTETSARSVSAIVRLEIKWIPTGAQGLHSGEPKPFPNPKPSAPDV
jgi:hypothetical protein